MGNTHNPDYETLVALKPSLETELQRVADWWMDHAVDEQNGGFYGQIDNHGTPDPEAPRGVILISRILWTFSTLTEYSAIGDHQNIANRAKDYLISHFLDQKNGGVFWEVDRLGVTTNTRKQGYAQAFALYGLAACHRALGDGEALNSAIALFDLIECHFKDDQHNGYWEAFAGDWSALEDVRLSEKDANSPKTMNTHLHLMEAYTELFRSWPDDRLRSCLQNLIHLHLDRIYDGASHHLRLFWGHDWVDHTETISFGHDIEASWLIWEACDLLGDTDLLHKAQPVVLALSEACLLEGTGPRGELFNERKIETGQVDETRIWWVQAEALVGFLNAFQMTGDPRYAEQVVAQWHFIEKHVIDPKAEWFWYSNLDSTPNPYRIGPWKACYHNVRALTELLRRINSLQAINQL